MCSLAAYTLQARVLLSIYLVRSCLDGHPSHPLASRPLRRPPTRSYLDVRVSSSLGAHSSKSNTCARGLKGMGPVAVAGVPTTRRFAGWQRVNDVPWQAGQPGGTGLLLMRCPGVFVAAG